MKVAQFCLTLCDPLGLYSPCNSPGQNTGEGSLSLLQRIFPTQGSNRGLQHCRWILYQLSNQGSPAEVRAAVKQPSKHRTTVHDEELASSKHQGPRLRSAALGHRREKSVLRQEADVSATFSWDLLTFMWFKTRPELEDNGWAWREQARCTNR